MLASVKAGNNALLWHPNAHYVDSLRLWDLIFDCLLGLLYQRMEFRKALLANQGDTHLERINETATQIMYYINGGTAILDQSSHDNIPETGLPNPADNGAVSLIRPRQDDDVYMASDQDILPELYFINNRWICKHIPPMINQCNNYIPLPRGPGFRFPWHLREARRITGACQTSVLHGRGNLTDCKPSHGIQKALLIGITYCHELPPDRSLAMPWKDVELMKNMLIEICHYKPENIVVMTDKPGTPEHLQPERGNILREFNKLVQNPSDGDDLFFYYAGHATQRKERVQGNERDHLDECLIPVDATNDDSLFVVDDELHSTLVQPLIQAGTDTQLIAVMDTCTSGTLLDLKHDLCNETRFQNDLWRAKALVMPAAGSSANNGSNSRSFCDGTCSDEEENIKANITCISACRDSQTIVEYERGGTLAGALNDYLRTNKQPRFRELFHRLRGTLKDHHKTLLTHEKRMQHGANQSQLRRRMPTKSPSLQISSMKPLKPDMLFRPKRANSGCH